MGRTKRCHLLFCDNDYDMTCTRDWCTSCSMAASAEIFNDAVLDMVQLSFEYQRSYWG